MVDFKKIKRLILEKELGSKSRFFSENQLDVLSQDVNVRQNIFDLSEPRNWKILSYNSSRKTYLIEWRDSVNRNVVMSCLKCDKILKPGKTYFGYEDKDNKKLVLVTR